MMKFPPIPLHKAFYFTPSAATPLPKPELQPITSPKAWVYVLTFLVVTALVVGLASFTLLQERARYRERAVVATQNIATLLEQHTRDVFGKIDFMVVSAAWYVNDMRAANRFDAERLERYLAHQVSLFPRLAGFRVTDSEGWVRFGLKPGVEKSVSVQDEPFFQAARVADGSRPVVMGPVYAPIAQQWVIVFACPLKKADGSFAGVVYANLPTNSFESVFASVQLGGQGAATIRSTDMALVHRVPTTKNAVGSRNVSKELSDNIAAAPERGAYVASTALDGIERSNAYRRVAQYPFYVIVGQATVDYMKGWIGTLVLVIGISGFALTGAGVAAWYAFRSQRRLIEDLKVKTALSEQLQTGAKQRDTLNAELEVKVRQAQAATVARDAFLAHVSHEMRTPLHQISGLTALIRKQPLSERQAGWLEQLAVAAQRMTAMVDQVLTYVKLESEQVSFSQTPLNLQRLLKQAEQRWRPRIEAKGLRFEVACEPVADVTGDAVYLGQAVDALLDNALHFTSAGSIELSCVLAAREPDALTLQFMVQDSGTGFDPQMRERLFGLFEQADSSSTTAQSGMGLSLAIVRKMARSMGGDAACSTRVGQGSQFWFTVRLRKTT